MTKITFAEIHSMQFGLTDGEIEECYLNNGVIEQPRTIYCFKKDEMVPASRHHIILV